MSEPDRDPVVRRAIDELRRLPAVDPNAVRRVVDAAAMARVSPAADEAPVITPMTRTIRVRAVIGIAAAAAFIGFAVSTMWRSNRSPSIRVASAPVAPPRGTNAMAQPTAAPLRVAANNESDLVALPHQFVFRSATAHRVSIVGDFNDWNPTRTPMQRAANDALWSVTVPMMPGRHVYAYMIDDSVLVLDPRAPRTRDPDLGAQGSVIMVGRP